MDWDDYAATWDERDEVRAYSSAAFDSLERCCRDLQFPLTGTRACDFGCGTGLLSEKLATKCGEVVAVDCSEPMIAVLRTKIAERGLDRIQPLAVTLNRETVAGSPHFHAAFDLEYVLHQKREALLGQRFHVDQQFFCGYFSAHINFLQTGTSTRYAAGCMSGCCAGS